MANSLLYIILICGAQNQKDNELEFLALLVSCTFDGLILITPEMTDKKIGTFADNGYFVGLIGRSIDNPNVPCSITDNAKFGREVIEHLIDQGHRKIAFISGYADATDSFGRLEGYMKGLRDGQLPFVPGLIDNGDFSEEGGYHAFMRLWDRTTEFTAVFAANDEMALGVYKACAELDIKILNRIADVGVDNVRLTNYVTPRISSVQQPLYTMGALLTEKLIDQMNDNIWAENRQLKVDSSLVIKGSS